MRCKLDHRIAYGTVCSYCPCYRSPRDRVPIGAYKVELKGVVRNEWVSKEAYLCTAKFVFQDRTEEFKRSLLLCLVDTLDYVPKSGWDCSELVELVFSRRRRLKLEIDL